MKKWYWAIVVTFVLLIFIIVLLGSGERSVSTQYFIPAGVFSPHHKQSGFQPVSPGLSFFNNSNNTKCTINIHPIGNVSVSNDFRISGATNAVPGRNVTLLIIGGCPADMPNPCILPDRPQLSGNSICCKWIANTKVIQGNDSINNWSLDLNETEGKTGNLTEGNYFVQARIDMDCISNVSTFRLS